MELNTVFNMRRSIRSFTGEAISDETLDQILRAANTAPVGMGKYDAVHLTVVKSRELLEKIEQNTAAVFHAEEKSFLYHAPELVIVSATGQDNVSCSNAAIIAHQMALEAVNCGVGVCYIWGCIIALAANTTLIRELEIPEGFTPSCAIVLGVSDETYSQRDIPQNRISINAV